MKNLLRNIAVSWIGIVAMMGTARANADRTVWDYSGVFEVTIDRPAKEVWPYFFGDKKEIWAKSGYTAVAGESGKVGEIYANAHTHTSNGDRAYFEAITVKPERQLVLKITVKEGGKAERTLVGYDFFTINEVAGRTTVVLAQAFALPLDIPKAGLNLKTKKQDKMLADMFQNLKRVVENSRQTTP